VLDILVELTAILQGHTAIAAGAAMPDLAIATESKGSESAIMIADTTRTIVMG
jgi:hypothetical protein